MKLSFSTLSCPRWGWNEIVSTAADLGYDGIEVRGVGKDISVPSVPEFSDDKLVETLSRLNSLNLKIPCLTSDCCINVKGDEEYMHNEINAYVDLAKKMNVPYIRVMAAEAVPEVKGEIDIPYIIEQAMFLGDMAKAQGRTILLETHGVWSDSEKFAKLMQDINHSNVNVLWDIHHPYRFMHETASQTYSNLKQWIKHVHAKDGVLLENGKYKYVLPGLGDIPIIDSYNILKENNYDGFFSLEWVKRWDLSLEEPGIVLDNFINYMKSL